MLLNNLIKIVILAIAYFLAGRLGLLLAIPPGYATAIFPSSGIALAAILLFGNRIWLGVLLGSFMLNITMAPQWVSIFSSDGLVAMLIAAGSTLQALFSAWLVRRFVRFPTELADERDIFLFYLLAGPVGCLISATMGTTTLFGVGAVSAASYIFNWWNWWVGDVIGVFIATPLVFVAYAKPRALWRQRISALAIPLLICMVIVISLFITASKWEGQQQQIDFKNYTQTIANSLQSNMNVYSAILLANKSYLTASHVNRTQFKTITTQLIQNYHGLQAMSWLPVIKKVERETLEKNARTEGYPSFQITERNQNNQIVSATVAEEYVPVTYIEPYLGNENALGFNLISNPIRQEALLRARDTGELVSTGRIKLVQEQGEQYGLLLIAPIYSVVEPPKTTLERIQKIRGYTSAVLRVSDILGDLITGLEMHNITLQVIDESAEVSQQVLFQSNNWNSRANQTSIEQNISVTIGGRNWRVKFLPLPGYLIEHRAWQAWATLAGGLLFTGLLGALLLLITGHTRKVQKVVDDRTNELRIILDNVLDGIFTLNQEGKILSFNRAAEKILGYQANEVTGQHFNTFIQDAQLDQAHIISYHGETVGRRKDGTNFIMELDVSQSAEQEMAIYICVIRDITERKRVDKMKSELVSTVSHELRTPLTSIGGALGLVTGGVLGEIPAAAKQMIDMAQKNCLRLSSLINDLLDMDKMLAGKMVLNFHIQPLMPLISQALDSIASYGQQYHVTYKLIAQENELVNVDGDRLIQVLNNFLSNAAKFSPKNEIVEVAVRRKNDVIRVEVINKGAGIPNNFRNRVFQKFSQADSSDTRQIGGTGLGLAISKDLIENMNGIIGFESIEGNGATFYFELPLTPETN
jgi:PAS domain S-box-containing protein